MIPSINTKMAENQLDQDLVRLQLTSRILASKVQADAERIGRVTHGISTVVTSPKRLVNSVRTNPAPYIFGIGGGLAVYGVIWLLKRLSQNIYIDREEA